MTVAELKKKYRELVQQGEAMREPYKNIAKSMPKDEEEQYEALMAEADEVWTAVEKEMEVEKHTKRLETIEEKIKLPQENEGKKETEERVSKQMAAFNEILKFGVKDPDVRAMRADLKVLQMDLDEMGGYLVAPQVFVEQLIQNVDDQNAIRGLATIIPLLSAESLGVPSLDTDLNDADWTAELGTGNQDDAIRFGSRELHPHPFAKRVRISNTLLRKAALDPESIVRERIAYKFAVTEEKAFLTGHGSNQPLGVFTASDQGITTGRDVQGPSPTAIAADTFIDTLHLLKPQYWNEARWIMHRNVVRDARKLKDGNGQYLWQPGLRENIPGTILDRPYIMSEYAPSSFTADQYIAIIGDFRFYWIADSLRIQIQVLDQLYAESNQTGYIVRAEVDGMPVKEEAFARMKMGS